MRMRKPKKPWQPLVRMQLQHSTNGVALELAKQIAKSVDEVWGNDRYTVTVRKQEPRNGEGPTLAHLSIHDHERTSRHDWRDFQNIKNDILGKEEEAIELYPAESRLVDMSNEYHLWCFIGLRLPIGFQERWVSEGGVMMGKSKQRPWPEGGKPEDLRDVTEDDLRQQLVEKKNEQPAQANVVQ